MNWNEYYLNMAKFVATKSKDESTKVGCVIVGPDYEVRSTGYNGFPRDVIDDPKSHRLQHPDIVHQLSSSVLPDGSKYAGGLVSDGEIIRRRTLRPAKYLWTEHAERNAIYNAARVGIPTKGCWLYLNYKPTHICLDCARAIIQSGICTVIGTDVPITSQRKQNQEQWDETFKITEQMFMEANIRTAEIPIGEL